MRISGLGLLAAATMVIAPLPAFSATSPPASAIAVGAQPVGLLAEAVQQQIALLERAGLPRRSLVAAAAAGGLDPGDPGANGGAVVGGVPGALLEPAGDLDRHGIRDVLESRYARASNGTSLVVFARDGSRGAVLWSKRVAVPELHLVLAVGLPTGPAGAPGVLLLDVGFTSEGSGSVTVTLTVSGLSRLGTALWSHRESGTMDTSAPGGGTVQHLPQLVGLPHATAPAADLLIARLDEGNDSSGTRSYSLTPVRLNTARGEVVPLGLVATSSSWFPSISAVGDLNGDRFDDLVIVRPGSGIQARTGSSGRALWDNTGLTVYGGAFALPAGDVHPSAQGKPTAADVAVSTGVAPPPPVDLGLLPVPDPTAPNPHGKVVLLDGSSGSTVWSRTGDYPYAVLKAGRAAVPALGVLTADTSSDSSAVIETLVLAAYDDAGGELYTKTFAVSTPKSSDSRATPLGSGIAIPFGDLEPDGAADGLALLSVASGKNQAEKQVVFRGIDGIELANATDMFPLAVSTTGTGQDLVTVTTGRAVTVTLQRGRDRGTLFSRVLPDTDGVSSAVAIGAILRPGRCADVLVLGQGKSHAVTAVLASSGAIRWAVHYAPGDVRPGTVVRPKTAPVARCG